MADFMEVSPAYGRAYKTGAEVQSGWDSGHDFHSPNHGYINKSDHANYAPDSQVIVRFGGKSSAQATKFYNVKHKRAK